MHFKNARNASVYAVFRAFFTQSLAKLRILYSNQVLTVKYFLRNSFYCMHLSKILYYGSTINSAGGFISLSLIPASFAVVLQPPIDTLSQKPLIYPR